MKGDEESLVGMRGTHDYVLVMIFDDGEDKIMLDEEKGIELILLNDTSFANPDMNVTDDKNRGIRPRWAIVLATSKEAEDRDVKPGNKVLLDTMKWSRGFRFDNTQRKMWRIPADDILAVDEDGINDKEMDKVAKWFSEFEDWDNVEELGAND